jgi:hypothetical protein
MLPLFQNHKIHFPFEVAETPDMQELLKQIKFTTWDGFGAHDDGIDCISQLGMIDILYPSMGYKGNDFTDVKRRSSSSIWGDSANYEEQPSAYDTYS